MNSITNLVMYHDFLFALEKHESSQDTLGIIKEYMCGSSMMPVEKTASLYTEVSNLKEDLSALNCFDSYKIEEFVGEQGNIAFFSKVNVKGLDILTVPLKFSEDVKLMVVPESLSKNAKMTVIGFDKVAEHFGQICSDCDQEEFGMMRLIQQILNRIPRDTILKMIDPEEYKGRIKSTFGGESDDMPEDSYQSGFGIYIGDDQSQPSQDLDGDEINPADRSYTGLFYDQLTPSLQGRPIYNDDGTMQLVCCKNGNFREFMVFESDDVRNTDKIEETFLVNKASILKEIDTLLTEANVAREVRKNTTLKANPITIERGAKSAADLDRGGQKVLAVPEEFAKRVKESNTRLRTFVANWRRAHDDNLREKLYNDEYIPLIDDIFEILISGAVGYGAVAIGLVNPLVGVVLTIATFIFANWRQREDRKRIIELLDDKINLLGEEIEDARIENDLVTKRQLIQIKKQLERKRAKLITGQSLGSR